MQLQLSATLFFFSLVFVVLSIVLSLYLIVQHLRYYTHPEQQRYIVRILFMVPTYALYSLFALCWPEYQTIFALPRDSYEAYVLYMFFALCVRYCGGMDSLELYCLPLPMKSLPAPLCFTQAKPSRQLLRICKTGTLQYVLIKPVLSILTSILYFTGHYHEGNFHDPGFVFISTINNISATISIYCLYLFYQTVKGELVQFDPWLKFIAIKIVVFFSWWQGLGIAILVAAGIIGSFAGYTGPSLLSMIQNTLICIEMFFVTILHIYAFPYTFYQDIDYLSYLASDNNKQGNKTPVLRTVTNVLRNVANSANQTDLWHDTLDAVCCCIPFWKKQAAQQEDVKNPFSIELESQDEASTGKILSNFTIIPSYDGEERNESGNPSRKNDQDNNHRDKESIQMEPEIDKVGTSKQTTDQFIGEDVGYLSEGRRKGKYVKLDNRD